MSRFVDRIGFFVLVGTSALGLAACGSSGSTTTVSTPNGSATVKTSNNGANASVDVKNNNGTVEITSGSGIPSGFPKAIPLPTFLKASASLGGQSKSGAGFDLTFNVSSNLEGDVLRYDDELRSSGLQETLTSDLSGTYEQFWKNQSWNVEVLGTPATGPGQPATITVTVSSRQ